MSSLKVGYAFDRSLQETANAAGRNYWYAYVAEILSRLGVCAEAVDVARCADPSALAEMGTLVLGDFDAPPGAEAALAEWVSRGGTLIGFGTRGLDSVFGVSGVRDVPQGRGPFTISGYFELHVSPVTTDCRAPMEPEQKLIITSPIRMLKTEGAAELARLFLCDPARPDDGSFAADAGAPAITHRATGRGHAFYFAFNVAQTMWVIQQGRPVTDDYDGNGYMMVREAVVVGENSCGVPYTDALHFLLANMIGRRPTPMIDAIPPREGRVAPALLYFGGDDEWSSGVQTAASDFMAGRGMPYHINCVFREGRFAIDQDEQARIEANGHEIALHYDFIAGFDHPCGFTREDVMKQAQAFRERFGRDSVCSVNHWLRWTGWADPARWMSEAGGRGDNSFFGLASAEKLNMINEVGFGFGSALPRYFWDDAEHGNARIDLVEMPVVAYEVGYLGEEVFPEKIKAVLDLAVRYRLTMNFFWHPIYVAQYPACQKAIDELLRLMGEMETPPVLMGPDALCGWWEARSRARIEGAASAPDGVRFEAECDHEGGFTVKVPTGDSAVTACLVDGAPAEFESAFEFGQNWAFTPLRPGLRVVELQLA